jgi:hypothetical protein
MAKAAVHGIDDFSGVLTFVAPSAGVTLELPVVIGGVLVLPLATAAGGADFQGLVMAAHGNKLIKATKVAGSSGCAWTVGAVLGWDTTNGFNLTLTGDTLGFIAAKPAATTDTVGWVLPIGA